LSIILGQFHKAKVICSEVTARQLSGFGVKSEVIIKKRWGKAKDYELEFFSYPSEMHLWDGILAFVAIKSSFYSNRSWILP
jgi:hypothetical protein